MIDTAIKARADEVYEIAMMLDEAAINARAFRMLLGNLTGRARTAEESRHEIGLQMVRAALVRAQITAIVAMLDASDKRGNRASLGHILKLLDDADLVATLTHPDPFDRNPANADQLKELHVQYNRIVESDVYRRIKDLRNRAIAHLLRLDSTETAVQNFDVSSIQDQVEELVAALFHGLGYGEPQFVSRGDMIRDSATLFWETYFLGLRGS